MTEYWDEHSVASSEKEMMLDEDAEFLGRQEVPEILAMLPDFAGKSVLELGAGIGRFSGHLAKEAESVVAVDFMESFVQKNRETNGHHKSLRIVREDVTKFSPEQKFDVIFSNWLFMYLADTEVHSLLSRMLDWLNDDGYLFFRESCFHKSGTRKRGDNPTKYREPAQYNMLLLSAKSTDSIHCYETVFSKSVQTYLKHKSNRNQICWLMKKIASESGQKFSTFQQFLDQQQYSMNGILRYEMIFGRHFVSTGGRETTEEFVRMLDLKPNENVLDVGCGIGGSAFLMAQDYDANVKGIDLSANMVSIALERANEIDGTAEPLGSKVLFEVCDATQVDYPSNSYDVIYSRDTILHIPDKKSLFKKFYDWLKPGGRLLISDYCCSPDKWSDVYSAYVKQRGYILLSVQQYGQVLSEIGFNNVKAEDRTQQFVEVLHRELTRLDTIKIDFLEKFEKEDFDAIKDGWEDKVKRCSMGDQKWGLFYAEKL